MICCDTLSEKYNQLRIDYVELLEKEFDMETEVERLREMYDNKLEELKSLRELHSLLLDKYDTLKQLEGFDEILGLIG